MCENQSHHLVTPGTGSAECGIFVRLILQYHYSLDKVPVCVEQSAQSTTNVSEETNENAPVADETLDDATIEEGDKHRRQISGAPMASMMHIENPESCREIICVAPA